MAQSVKHSSLDFGSGLDLTVCDFEPRIGLHANSALGILSLSLSLSLCPSPICGYSLSQNKSINFKKEKKKQDCKPVLCQILLFMYKIGVQRIYVHII